MKLLKLLKHRVLSFPKPRLIISKEVYDFIIETTKSSPKVETGGILMGFDREPMDVEVIHASLPGPNAFHSPTKFLRDTEYCSKVLLENHKMFGIDYVGEWHSHVVPMRKISGGDLITLSSILFDPDYSFNAFACIVALLEDDHVDLLGYVAKKKYIYSVDLEIK